MTPIAYSAQLIQWAKIRRKESAPTLALMFPPKESSRSPHTRRMYHSAPSPRATTPPGEDHLQRRCVIELPYLLDGKRVFVATDERGWMIARGMGSTDAECQRVIASLNDALEAPRVGPRLVLDAS